MSEATKEIVICHNITGALGSDELPEILKVIGVGTETIWQPAGMKRTASGFVAHRVKDGEIHVRASGVNVLRKIAEDKKAMQKDYSMVLRLHAEDDTPTWTITLSKVRFLSITLAWDGSETAPREVMKFTADSVKYSP